ncbi:MAG: hypothetical protein ACRCX2_33885 [Paraclostridium sp.]
MNTDLLNEISNLLDMKLQPLISQLSENTQILKSLEHSNKINKAEQDKIINDIAHIKGDINTIKNNLANVEIITASNWQDIAKLKKIK